MKKTEIIPALIEVKMARAKWNAARRAFDIEADKIMARLLHEGARAMMSHRDIAKHAGLSSAQVKRLMLRHGFNPRDGKRMLSEQASKALNENAELMGVEVEDMDLMSPLAYLPAGSVLRRAALDTTTEGVTEFPETDEVTVKVDDLRAVLKAADYMSDLSLRGPVDRMGDALALVAFGHSR